MNLDDLRAVQVDERGTDSLQPLRDSFYRDVAAYIDRLRKERERAAAAADDPFDSDEVRQLTDEIETVEEVIEAIYDRRMGKVVKRASLAASGMQTDETGLTDEEAELFDGLVGLIEANRRDVLSTIDGEGVSRSGGPSADEAPADEAPAPPPDEALDESESAAEENGDPEPAGDDEERLTVRITQDIGEIFGVDERVYELSAEDVVSLPAANAEPLLDRDAAKKLG
jgi:DNA replication factor GINS